MPVALSPEAQILTCRSVAVVPATVNCTPSPTASSELSKISPSVVVLVADAVGVPSVQEKPCELVTPPRTVPATTGLIALNTAAPPDLLMATARVADVVVLVTRYAKYPRSQAELCRVVRAVRVVAVEAAPLNHRLMRVTGESQTGLHVRVAGKAQFLLLSRE